ncbi:hypothetical protein GQ44DRAFT_582948, partial [Phaeosphaeriaceae sp. PMI808]
WKDLITWDDDENLFDPLFDADTTFAGLQGENHVSDYHLSESVTSEQPYLVSAPPSLADGLSSLECNISAPPSILGGSSSFGQVYCTSPSIDTATTSPLVDRLDGRNFGSLGTCDSATSPLAYSREYPILDTRYERIADSFTSTSSLESTTETVFNPHVAGSSHSFSGLDVRTSQVFANVGTWTDQPLIIEPISEADEPSTEVVPIAIPYSTPHSSNGTSTLFPRSEDLENHIRSRAVTIPQSNRRPMSYNAAVQSHWASMVPPILSVSPVAQNRPLGSTLSLSRSSSHARSRRSAATPSPTPEGFGWVSYQMNSHTKRLTPTSTEGMQGRTPRGRKKGLNAEQRHNAALMRIIGACGNCQRRKEKCDPGTPCKSCLEHYKGDLVNHPCRDRVLSDQSGTFLSKKSAWHPTARSLESFIASSSFNRVPDVIYNIPLCFGFGPPLYLLVHALNIEEEQERLHEHVIYAWPPGSGTGSKYTHAVLPALLTKESMLSLMEILDSHLSLLVSHHFRQFPLFCSPLRILREVYIFSRSRSPHCRTLHQALKLLVLVHIGGDISLPSPKENPALSQLVQSTMDRPDNITPTPCFIRSQFGSIMPDLALGLMKEVLSSLELLLLNRECDDWPMALAVLITVLMVIESIHYHAAKLPYHNSFDTLVPWTSTKEENHEVDEKSVNTLLSFYSSCFAGCHARLRPDWEGEAASQTQCKSPSPEDIFVEGVRQSIKMANDGGYMLRKATDKRQDDDMDYFFDRLVARLL